MFHVDRNLVLIFMCEIAIMSNLYHVYAVHLVVSMFDVLTNITRWTKRFIMRLNPSLYRFQLTTSNWDEEIEIT